MDNIMHGKIYFRKTGKIAVINLTGDEVDELKKKMKTGDSFVVRLEEDGTKIILKQERSIKI